MIQTVHLWVLFSLTCSQKIKFIGQQYSFERIVFVKENSPSDKYDKNKLLQMIDQLKFLHET